MKKTYNSPLLEALALLSEDVCILSMEGDGDVVGIEFTDWIKDRKRL